MRLANNKIPDDVLINEESQAEAVVICKRCNGEIGRLQTTPPEPEADMGEVYAEVRLIAAEHRQICTAG